MEAYNLLIYSTLLYGNAEKGEAYYMPYILEYNAHPNLIRTQVMAIS
jgi:hypothetical protein